MAGKVPEFLKNGKGFCKVLGRVGEVADFALLFCYVERSETSGFALVQMSHFVRYDRLRQE